MNRHLVPHLGPAGPPPRRPYDLVVIGGGPAGLTAARAAARAGQNVALVERALLGGTSFNHGSIPSKALLRTARWFGDLHDGVKLGGVALEARPDFARAMARMRRIRAQLAEQNSAERLAEAGIDLFPGQAAFTGPDSLTAGDTPLAFRKALVATGARPKPPGIPGLAEGRFHTSRTIFGLERCPRTLLIIGGGPLGCEFGQVFAQLGARVVIAQKEAKFLPAIERDAAQTLSRAVARYGVEIHLDTAVTAVRDEGALMHAELSGREKTFTVPADAILAGVGRLPCTDGLGLDRAGVLFDAAEGIHVDEFLQTSNPDIYAAGDVCMKHNFANAAQAYARLALGNMSGGEERQSALVVPRCTYTDPEIAHVGLLIQEAREQGIPVSTVTVMLHEVDRAVTDGEEEGFLKVHLRDGTDEILGATAVGRHTGEMIAGIVAAMTFKTGLRRLGKVIQPYPTVAEIARMAAETFERSRQAASPAPAQTFNAS